MLFSKNTPRNIIIFPNISHFLAFFGKAAAADFFDLRDCDKGVRIDTCDHFGSLEKFARRDNAEDALLFFSELSGLDQAHCDADLDVV